MKHLFLALSIYIYSYSVFAACPRGYVEYRPEPSVIIEIHNRMMHDQVRYTPICYDHRSLELTINCDTKDVVEHFVDDLEDETSSLHIRAVQNGLDVIQIAQDYSARIDNLVCN